ncbi:hypothetical protein LXA43DRAFT_113861 [Ganoderma leucocontextum]|nr:hypothetical protein LXA43DRAFT_113861 [Ganoderma leucocontextum]
MQGSVDVSETSSFRSFKTAGLSRSTTTHQRFLVRLSGCLFCGHSIYLPILPPTRTSFGPSLANWNISLQVGTRHPLSSFATVSRNGRFLVLFFVLDDLANFPSALRVVNLDGGLVVLLLGTLALWITSPRQPALTTIRLLLPIGRRCGEITQDILWFAEFVHRACINCGIHVGLSTGVDQHISRSYVPATVELLAAAVVNH